LFARFIDDAGVELAVRHDPAKSAAEHQVPLAFAQWLAALPRARIASFRQSRVHKDAVRAGAAPSRV
jgi:hypothetical protein